MDGPKLKRCRCGATPTKEAKTEMLGKIRDGGYEVTIGRYKCPSCGIAPDWGRCYSVYCGWENNVDVWNGFVSA